MITFYYKRERNILFFVLRTFYFVTFLQRVEVFGGFFSLLIRDCLRSMNYAFSDVIVNVFQALPWLSHVVDRSLLMSQWHTWFPTITHSFSKNSLIDFLSLALFIEYSLAKFLILYLRNSKLNPCVIKFIEI